MRDRLQADKATTPESLARLASASFDLGSLTNEIGDKQDALAAFQESQSIWQKLADDNPNVIKFQRDLAVSRGNIANLLREPGKLAEALKSRSCACDPAEAGQRQPRRHSGPERPGEEPQ